MNLNIGHASILAYIVAFLITIGITFPLTVAKGHTDGLTIPYISTTIAMAPEKVLGGVGLSITALAASLTFYFRYNWHCAYFHITFYFYSIF